jgi:glycosyltransferase involved in cell wall biosynthesis
MALRLRRDFTNDQSNDSIILICVVRDELLLLEYFIQHYVQLGVTHFVFVDNGSDDDTVEYLLNRTDIDCQIYHTTDSYAENEYGITWVNEILDTQCKDKWCVVVDIDELIMPRNDETLTTIKHKMEDSNQNVLPTCLIDFYPKHLDTTPYKSGNPFYLHSNHYDKFVEDDLLIYPGEGGELVVKGGSRHRVFGANREPVCLTKKSFFKYDFFKTHKLAVGMHWLLPRNFDHTANLPWSVYTDWPNMNKYLKLHPTICALGHFKFIKPDIYKFFRKRVERNQDWGNSDEYRNYIKTNPSSFFKNDISVAFESVDKIYEDVFDEGINKREFIIIVSGQRHGSTTLCERLNSISQSVSLFEAFNCNQGIFANIKSENLKTEINEVLNSCDWMNKKYVSFKVFRDHSVNLEKLLTCGISVRVVFLKRSLKDSYSSWVRAVKTGNWGTTPGDQKADKCVGHRLNSNKIRDYGKYESDMVMWFLRTKKLVLKYKVPHTELWFGGVICDEFDPVSILYKTNMLNS